MESSNPTVWSEPFTDPREVEANEAYATQVAREFEEELAAEDLKEKVRQALPDLGTNPTPSLPARPESVDRSLKTKEDRDYWATRTSKKARQHQREVDSRRIEGLAKNAATQNRNEQRHFQIQDRKLNALDGGQIDIKAELLEQRKRIDGFIARYEMDRKADREEMDRFKADLMEEVLSIKELLNRL